MSAAPEPAQTAPTDPALPVHLEIMDEQQTAIELLIVLLAISSPHGRKFSELVKKFRDALKKSKNDPPSEAYIGVLDRVSEAVESLSDLRRTSR